jgi:hypothetical protein
MFWETIPTLSRIAAISFRHVRGMSEFREARTEPWSLYENSWVVKLVAEDNTATFLIYLYAKVLGDIIPLIVVPYMILDPLRGKLAALVYREVQSYPKVLEASPTKWDFSLWGNTGHWSQWVVHMSKMVPILVKDTEEALALCRLTQPNGTKYVCLSGKEMLCLLSGDFE